MCDWDVSLRCRHCRSSRPPGQREPIHPERGASSPPEQPGSGGRARRRSERANSLCRIRQEEKEELQRLNNCLAQYIEHNCKLQRQLQEQEETSRKLQEIREQRDRLEVQLANLSAENRDLRERKNKASAEVRDLENSLRCKDDQLEMCRNEKRNLENELNTVRRQFANEIEDLRKHYEDKLENMDCANRQRCESKLIEALEQLREDHNEKLREYRENLERDYKIELENCQQSAARYRDLAEAAKEEAAAARIRAESKASELRECRSQTSALRRDVQDLQEMLDREKARNQQLMEDYNNSIAEANEKMRNCMEDYNVLFDVKLALDMELAAYRKMLEKEEQRLDLTPCASSLSLPSTSRGSASFRGTKRRLYADEIAGTDRETHEHVITVGKITLEEVDNEGRFVKVKNTSDQDQSLSGWTIVKEVDDVSRDTYRFPPRFTIRAGQAVKIWAGAAGPSQRSALDLTWKGQRSWGTGVDIRVILVGSSGEEISRRVLVQRTLGTRSRRGIEDDSPTV